MKLKYYDTTLREGFQTPGVGASEAERVAIAKKLVDFYRGAAIIEIGMPANEVDYTLIQSIVGNVKGQQYAFLLRCHDLDVGRARQVFVQHPDNLAHLFIGTSEQHRKIRFNGNWSIDDYCTLIESKVGDVASDSHVKQVMFSPEDALRTFWEGGFRGEILKRFIDAALRGYEAGNRSVGRPYRIIFNLPDTVGIGTVNENREMFRFAQQTYGSSVEFSIHIHNDLDCATATTIDAVLCDGVLYPQVAFAGSGERNGIAKAEPVIVALDQRGVLRLADDQAYSLTETSRDIAHLMGIYLDPRYPITGVDTNVSTAGIHAQTARKSKDTYHYMGERYGNPVRILFGTTSGGDTARSFLEINGYEFSDEQLTEYTNFMKRKANELKHYLTETEMAIFAEQIINGRNRNGFRIDDYRIESVMSSHDASVIFYTDGHMWGCSGVGAVDSAFNGLRQRFGYEEAKLTAFKPVIKGIGQKAQMQVMSVIDYQGKSYWGRGVSEDVAKAPVDSVIDAFHNMHFLLNKQ